MPTIIEATFKHTLRHCINISAISYWGTPLPKQSMDPDSSPLPLAHWRRYAYGSR